MPMGAGGARWCRLLLIVLLVLPRFRARSACTPTTAGSAVSDPDRERREPARVSPRAVPSDSAWIPPAPTSAGRAGRPDPRDPVVAGWTCLTPTDRAPPRA